MELIFAHISMHNVCIDHNTDSRAGGAWLTAPIECDFDRVTFINNTAENEGYGYQVVFSTGEDTPFNGNVRIINSVIWGYQRENRNEDIWVATSDPRNELALSFGYSVTRIGRESIRISPSLTINWLEGNIDSDPLFLDSDNGDYHLQADSPCIDAGDPDSPHDPDGTRSDMGAFYFHQRDIEVEPVRIQFPPTPEGEVDSTTFTVRNSGGTPLLITSVLTPNNMSRIGVRPEFGEGDDPIELSPDSSMIFWVFFDASPGGGPDNSTISIGSNDPDEPEIIIEAFGEVENSVENDPQLSAFDFQLSSAYPNPFNSTTTIHYSTGRNAYPPRLAVYGIDGRMVADLTPPLSPPVNGGGMESVVWNADGLPGGIYLIRLEAGKQTRTKKTLLLR